MQVELLAKRRAKVDLVGPLLVKRVDINVGGRTVSLSLGMRQPRRARPLNARVMNASASFTKWAVHTIMVCEHWHVEHADDGYKIDMNVPRSSHDPGKAWLDTIRFDIHKSCRAKVQQFGHLQFFLAVCIDAPCTPWARGAGHVVETELGLDAGLSGLIVFWSLGKW